MGRRYRVRLMCWKSITARKAEKQLFKEKDKLDNQKEVDKPGKNDILNA